MRGMHRLGRVLVTGLLASSLCVPMFGQAKSAQPSKAGQASAAKASQSGAPAAHKLPEIKFEKYKLKNGLEVILSEDHRLPLVAVDLWYHVGPAYEKPGRTGFAHLFEHMMFQGSKHVDKQLVVLEGAGALTINGTTDFDRTNYFETMPANQLETALWLESDRMGWLLDKLDEKKLANQRDVVRNERRQGENSPYEVVDEAMWHQLFPKGHPYYGDVIGSHADIEAADLGDLRDFFKTYYAPNNATMAIVGDYDPKTIKALVEKYFGPIPAAPVTPEKLAVAQPKITSEKKITVTDTIQLPRLYMAWQTPAIFQPGDAELDLLQYILGSGRSSRLYKKLVYEKQIAQSVSANQQNLQLGSVFQIVATAKPGVKLEDLQAAIEEELANIQKNGPTAEELERARNTIVTQRISGMQRLGGFGGVADQLNYYNHYEHDPGYMTKDIARYENATPASVQKWAETLTPNSRVVAYGVPGKKELEDVPQKKVDPNLASQKMPGGPGNDEWRETAPKPTAVKAPRLPSPKEFKLANGMTVLLVEDHKLPVMTANLTVREGADANPAERPGLASFTAAMLMEGTQKHDSELNLADAIAKTGGSVNAFSSYDASTVSSSGLTWRADQLFDLVSDVATHPVFPEAEIDRLRQRRLVALLQQKDNPNTLATKVFYHEVYGDKSPYGYIDSGTEAGTKATTREDMMNFYKSGFGPKNAVLSVAGDFTEPQLKTLAEKYFGGWTGDATKQAPPKIEATTAKRIVIVDKPGANQSALRIGQVGLARSNPDYVAVNVMNDILGGLFSSRINLNLREQHGYTYGAGSGFQFRRAQGPFMVGSMVRQDATAPSVTEVFKELEKMRTTQPSPEEVNTAKESFIRGLTGIFETTQQTAGTMANLFVYDLPLTYYADLPKQIEAVDAAKIEQVAEKYLAPDKMVIVIAGDRSKIEDSVKALNMPTAAQDAEGKPMADKPAGPGNK